MRKTSNIELPARELRGNAEKAFFVAFFALNGPLSQAHLRFRYFGAYSKRPPMFGEKTQNQDEWLILNWQCGNYGGTQGAHCFPKKEISIPILHHF